MGLSDIMPSSEVVGVVTGHHVPSHSRESSTSSTASAASICSSNGGLIQTAQEEHTSSSSPMPIYSPLSKCSSPTANHSVIIWRPSLSFQIHSANTLKEFNLIVFCFPYRGLIGRLLFCRSSWLEMPSWNNDWKKHVWNWNRVVKNADV
jgi:hypothetical protein